MLLNLFLWVYLSVVFFYQLMAPDAHVRLYSLIGRIPMIWRWLLLITMNSYMLKLQSLHLPDAGQMRALTCTLLRLSLRGVQLLKVRDRRSAAVCGSQSVPSSCHCFTEWGTGFRPLSMWPHWLSTHGLFERYKVKLNFFFLLSDTCGCVAAARNHGDASTKGCAVSFTASWPLISKVNLITTVDVPGSHRDTKTIITQTHTHIKKKANFFSKYNKYENTI